MNYRNSAEMEVIRRVYEMSSKGECLEIIPDCDGLGLVEIRFVSDVRETISSFTFTPDAAPLVASAILECAKELKAKEGK